MALPCLRCCIGGLAVIGIVGGHGCDRTLSLPEQGQHLGRVVSVPFGQHMGCDLARVGIDGKVQLAPLPPRPAMLLGIPLALAEQFQPCAVQHEVDRASAGLDTRLPPCERPPATT